VSQERYRSGYLVVYDDVLSPSDFDRLFRYLNSAQYQSVHANGWRRVWRLHDGNPLTSSASWYYPTPPARPQQGKIFPTQTPVDAVIAWIVENLPELQSLIGRPSVEWSRFSIAPWIYPPGTGLSLHRDGGPYSGAFTFFVHRRWDLHWGGHLLVLDPQTAQRDPATGELSPPFLDDEEETARVFDPGMALTVFAKPNRIVFMSPNAQHMVTRVDVNAGQMARVSVGGFFLKSLG
jgi:hypothetical protein